LTSRSDEKTNAGGAGWAGPTGTTDWQPFVHRFTIPAGIRFIVDADQYARTLQYIELPDKF
jgi:hypothetical protein